MRKSNSNTIYNHNASKRQVGNVAEQRSSNSSRKKEKGKKKSPTFRKIKTPINNGIHIYHWGSSKVEGKVKPCSIIYCLGATISSLPTRNNSCPHQYVLRLVLLIFVFFFGLHIYYEQHFRNIILSQYL